MKNSAQILESISERDRTNLSSMYGAFNHLTKFGNIITPDGMIEFFEEERAGNYQWERFIKADRDVIAWFNGMDMDNRKKFTVNLLLGEGMYSKKIKNNL